MPTIAFFLLMAAAAVQAFVLLRTPRRPDAFSPWLLLAAALLLAGVILERSIKISFVALTGTFESLLFYALCVSGLAFAYRMQKKIAFFPFVQFALAMLALVLLALASSPLAPKEILPPIPALRSSWLVLHVAFSFIGEAFFAVSFVASLAFLVSKNEERRLAFDRLAYTAIGIGYPVFTAGALIFGAVWAEAAWGSWWSWDPKETWALVTWLVYTLYLHLRLIARRNDGWTSLVSVIGFLLTLFTFFGVNYLLPGLHSYG
jgi:ABC-type transport system involved in cytochrome c biogenesis permease subunit